MTEKDFIKKWKHLVADNHASYSSDAHILYWAASYHTDAEYIKELTDDFLSIPDVSKNDGMAYRRAKSLAKGASHVQ